MEMGLYRWRQSENPRKITELEISKIRQELYFDFGNHPQPASFTFGLLNLSKIEELSGVSSRLKVNDVGAC